MQATELWTHWQELLEPCAEAFTYWGFQRFTEWLTGLALNVEEHTITQSLVGLARPGDWKALESFAEYGAWHLAVFDGGFALRSVVRPLVRPAPGQPRVEVLTRLRGDARLHALPEPEPARRGPKRKWGKRLPPPRQGGRWRGRWQAGTAWIYG